MKTIFLFLSFLSVVPVALAGGDDPVDPNPSFQKLIKGTTRIVVRDGGDVCCVTPTETLKQPVYFEIKDLEEIGRVAANIRFKAGTARNECFCCGHPGIDWYVGNRRVAITGLKHGFGLMRNSVIAVFSPESKEWVKTWLMSHGLTEEQIR